MAQADLQWRVDVTPDTDEPKFAAVTLGARIVGNSDPLDIQISASTQLAPPSHGVGSDGWSLRAFPVNVDVVSKAAIIAGASYFDGRVLGTAQLVIGRDQHGGPIARVIPRSGE